MSVENVYKNLDEKSQLSLNGKKPQEIINRLDKVYDMILTSKNKNKWDDAYLFCRRWNLCVDWLKRQRIDKDLAQKYYSSKRQMDVKRLFTEIKLKIESDLEKRQRKLQNKNTPNLRKSISQANDEEDIESLLPDVPTEEPEPKNKNEITCTELYNIMHNTESREKGVLIIDLRHADDFAAAKMAFQDYMINIPGSKIWPKRTANDYQMTLMDNDAAIKLFERRADMDLIVLVDETCLSNKAYSSITLFKNFLEEHDKVTNYNRVAILQGGFDKWMKTYPKLVVRPEVKKPDVINVDQQNDIKKEIENNFGFECPPSPNQNTNTSSPTLSTKTPGIKSVSFAPTPPQVMSNNDMSTYKDVQAIPPFIPVPNQTKNNTLKMYNISLLSNNRTSDQQMLPFNTHSQQGIVSSVISPSVLLSDISNYSEIPSPHPVSAPPSVTNHGYYPTLNGAPRMRTAKVVIEKLTPAKPTVDRSNKPIPGRKLSNDNTQIVKLEGDIQDTRSIIAQFERTMSRGNLDDWSKEQYDICKKKEEELCTELEKLKNQGPSAPKNGKLYPDLTTNLSVLALNNKPRSTRLVKPDIKNDDKENIQQPQVKIERIKIDPPASTLMPRPPPQQQMQSPTTPQVQRMEIDEPPETYREPLRSESTTPSNSGLKRSYSSPNLQKALQNKEEGRKFIPEIDRSSKPQVPENNVRVPVLSSKHREDRMEPVYGNNHPGITGLKNLGNSCYMNSIIQCLSNTCHLANYFNHNQYSNDLTKKNDKNASGYVAEEVAQVIKALWRGQYKSISPRDLKVVVGQYKFQFESYDQQDSHEFLMFLLEWMHNDLKQKNKVSYNRELTVAEKEWEKSWEGQSSIISNLFYGQLRSTIECTTCMQTSTTYETFNSLTMSLPTTNKCTLDDCVKKFVSGQKVSGWKCPNCKAPRDGVKKFDIAKLPHTIIIHLNRFGDSGGWLEKKNTAVDFPLMQFDLKPYVVADSDDNSPSSQYNLYAMSNHYGTMDGGHYTAYCKSVTQRKWYKYDDHTVSEVPPNQVKSQSTSAYLLFYSLVSAERTIPNS
ncbi:ubiquitin carboxyl-terminal hydrolase 8-like isoform X2 [Phymastichus coffea]|uniref:ubiquitin carboxyl-terminal hydrolase 8-like isoform X2 n=1 Tax=Phymastichus coffea TaxID=108790 RepID=UPI00273B9DD3|nr:ubiquitin carboxyl-terminal hydrolase 8-like isoform X2 [Phymastichus coffea]